jgi:hypothetical protein
MYYQLQHYPTRLRIEISPSTDGREKHWQKKRDLLFQWLKGSVKDIFVTLLAVCGFNSNRMVKGIPIPFPVLYTGASYIRITLLKTDNKCKNN